jgi:hypothetical protein
MQWLCCRQAIQVPLQELHSQQTKQPTKQQSSRRPTTIARTPITVIISTSVTSLARD